jgi:hypothetical protein
MSLADWLAAKEARKQKRPGLAHMSKDKQAEKVELRRKFHNPVIKRDGGDCVYCTLFFDRSRPAQYGDHMLTQKKWPELRFELWVGAATCRWCNGLRDLKVIESCVIRDGAGVIQCARHDKGAWFGRLVSGDHVGEFHELPTEEVERYDLRNDVLI